MRSIRLYGGLSLNDCLLQGPDWATPLIDVFNRFRLGAVAVAAVIQEMLLQIKIPEDQRDALQLLWWPDGDFQNLAVIYRLTVHPFGAASSPFCTNFVIRRRASQYGDNLPASMSASVANNF
ncbi:unnamed protein product [Echinostoma caproni]|uniref:Uncharacterized protein n=1 Tax=Echinostoma caproni TaxID=27848 RepID=A0A183BD93_9TREM|nr:unnamed protein product [Echinostoma caproni]